jgi:hypothetical protein
MDTPQDAGGRPSPQSSPRKRGEGDDLEFAPIGRVRVRDQLRHKLPEILLEAASVVLAILLAFGVDQWREDRSRREMAERARATIMSELRANRAELQGTTRLNGERIAVMEQQIAMLQKKQAKSLDTGMNLSQLSSAAFQAAQSTQAIQFIDFEWLVRVGRVYELQKTYLQAQDTALNEVSMSLGVLQSGEEPLPVIQRVKARLVTAQQLGTSLVKAYDEVIGG